MDSGVVHTDAALLALLAVRADSRMEGGRTERWMDGGAGSIVYHLLRVAEEEDGEGGGLLWDGVDEIVLHATGESIRELVVGPNDIQKNTRCTVCAPPESPCLLCPPSCTPHRSPLGPPFCTPPPPPLCSPSCTPPPCAMACWWWTVGLDRTSLTRVGLFTLRAGAPDVPGTPLPATGGSP